MADELRLAIDTRAGRIALTAGRPFVGGVYALTVVTDGQNDTSRLVRFYRIDQARGIRWPLAEAKGGQELALDSADFRKAWTTVAPSRTMPCEVFAYADDAIVAHGFVTVEWSPTLTTVDGTPIDVRGPQGDKGEKGDKGDKGDPGKSAYEGAVENGYDGNEGGFYDLLGGLDDLVEAAATSARAAATSAETAAAETLVGAEQLTKAVRAKEDAEDSARRAEEAASETAEASAAAEAAKEAAATAEAAAEAIAEAVAGLASEADVDSKIAAHNAAEDAHADIREKLADKAESSELVTETEAREQGDADTLASAKAYADGKVAGAYRYKGTVATVDDLPASGNAEGDVWNVSADGMNYAWTGSAWDALGASVDLSDYSTTEEMNAAIQRHNTSSVAHSTYIAPLRAHAKNKENPHEVTAEQVGALTEEAADARYLKLTGGNTISGTQNVTGDIKLPAHTLTAGNVVVARPPASPNNMVRRADFPDWVLAGDGLTASADDTDKVTLAVKPATASSLGGVKVGEGLTVAEDGTLSATGTGVAIDTAMPASPADDHVPSTQLLKEQLDGKLSLSGGTMTGDLKFADNSKTLWVGNIKSATGSPIFDVSPSKGFNFKSIYTLSGYKLRDVDNGMVFFKQEDADTNWLDATTLKEGGTPIANKYAPKSHTHAQADVTGLADALSAKQDKLVAGTNITLTAQSDGTVKIDATGGGGGGNVTYNALSSGFSVSIGDKSFGLKEGFDDARIVNLSFDNSLGSNVGKSLATTDYVDEAGQAFLKKTDVDGAFLVASENPVQNKVIANWRAGVPTLTWNGENAGLTIPNGNYQLLFSENEGQDGVTVKFNMGGGTPFEKAIPLASKSYVDGLIGDISAALAAI